MSEYRQKSRLRVIPYNVIVAAVFLVVLPASLEPALLIYENILGWFFGADTGFLSFDWEVWTSNDYRLAGHWFELVMSEEYQERTMWYSDKFFKSVYILALPIILMGTIIIASGKTPSKLQWVGIFVGLGILYMIGMLVLSFIGSLICGDWCEHLKDFLLPTIKATDRPW